MLSLCCCSVIQLCPTLWPRGLQHIKTPCPSPSPGVCPSSCSVHWWCHPAISYSDTLFFCPQSFPKPGAFPTSHLFASGDQTTGTSALASILPVNFQGWSPLRLTGLSSLLSNELFRSLLQHHSSKASILWHSASFIVQHSQLYMTSGKTIALTIRTFVSKVMSLNLNLPPSLEKTSPALWEQNYKRYEIVASWCRHLI